MGHAPAVRASRALRAVNVRKTCVRAISLARRKSLTLAVISAAVCYISLLLDADAVMYASGTITLAAVRLAHPAQKGGEL